MHPTWVDHAHLVLWNDDASIGQSLAHVVPCRLFQGLVDVDELGLTVGLIEL